LCCSCVALTAEDLATNLQPAVAILSTPQVPSAQLPRRQTVINWFCLPLLRMPAASGPTQAGEGLQLLDWSVSAKAQLKSWNAYDLVAPRVPVYYRTTENNFKVRNLSSR
jgi:hypothetical protein